MDPFFASRGGGDGAGLLPSRERDVRGELAHVGCACVLECTLCTPIAQTNTRALPPARAFERCCPPSRRPVERTLHNGDPLEHSVRDGSPATAGAPSTGASSRHVASSGKSAAAGSSAEARGPRLRYLAPEGKLGKNNCRLIGKRI